MNVPRVPAIIVESLVIMNNKSQVDANGAPCAINVRAGLTCLQRPAIKGLYKFDKIDLRTPQNYNWAHENNTKSRIKRGNFAFR